MKRPNVAEDFEWDSTESLMVQVTQPICSILQVELLLALMGMTLIQKLWGLCNCMNLVQILAESSWGKEEPPH